MFNESSLRHQYTQFFVILILCSLFYVMIQSISNGAANLQDNLYKKNLIEKANLFRMKIGDRVLPVALVGKDGWVDYIGDNNIEDFQNLTKIEHKRVLFKKLVTFNKYLKSKGITLLIVVAPNKATIYPDKLPEQIKSLPIQSRLDSLISYLEDNNVQVMVDLRPALKAARQSKDVYYKENNTHWNAYGAFVAYSTIINHVGRFYPELRPYNIANLTLVASDSSIVMPDLYFVPKDPFVQTLYLNDHYGYNQFSSIEDSKLPTLLMFHDSFGEYYLNDYLSMNFGKSHFIHRLNAPKYLNPEAIQQFNPDIIIIEIVERNLDGLANLLSNFGPK